MTSPVRDLHVDEVHWELVPAKWPQSQPVVEVALDALQIIDDELARAVIARLATTIIEQREELTAVRAVLSAAFTFSTDQFEEATSARNRLAERHRHDWSRRP